MSMALVACVLSFFLLVSGSVAGGGAGGALAAGGGAAGGGAGQAVEAVMPDAGGAGGGAPVASLFELAIMIAYFIGLLFLCAFGNDFIVLRMGKRWLKLIALVLAIGVAPCLLLQLPLAAFALVGACAIALMHLWGSFLATLAHRGLQAMTALAFVFAGLVALSFFQLQELVAAALLTCSLLCSLVCHVLIDYVDSYRMKTISKSFSRQRMLGVRGLRTGLPTVGFLLGASAYIVVQLAESSHSPIVFGGCFLAAGLMTLLLRSLSQNWLEDITHRTLALSAAICLAPMLLAGSTASIALAVLLLAIALVNTIITINVVAEISRFNMVSAIWVIGSEGSLFFIGAGLGVLLFAWGMGGYWSQGFAAAICLSIVACAAAQVFTERHSFKFLSYYVEEPPEGDFAPAAAAGDASKPSGWQAKLELLAQAKQLSPRQAEVMELIAKGKSVSQITKRFNISEATAKTHIYNMYRRLGVHTRQELLDLIETADDSEAEG
jgi:DNA-binding CsgD family transcriptional regulator